MLPKPERLKKCDFVGVRPRIVFRGTFVDISVVKTEGISRFACVIAKKRIKRAVDRNRVKRKIYHIVREIKPNNPYLVIVYPKITTLHANKRNLKEEISVGFATL